MIPTTDPPPVLNPHDPLTLRYARYPHESATAADYAQFIEPHEPDYENDLWFRLSVAVSLTAALGVITVVVFQWWTQ